MSKINNLSKEYKDIVGNEAFNNKNVTIKSIVKDYSDKFNKLQVCFISDTHIGSSDFDINGLIENLKYADSQENAVIFFLGDGMNTAIIGSKSDPYEDVMNTQKQLSFYSKILQLAKGNQKLTDVLSNLENSGKVIVVHSGNHEDRITKAVGVSTTKMAAEIAGVGDAYAPFYASTTLLLRQPQAKDGKFPIRIITHHGTGIRNSDGIFRLIKNVGNVDMAVIGHTHQHTISNDRTIRLDEDGNQYYQDIVYITLPASGGGTYGAGMALPDIAKQSAVWVEICSQSNPNAGKISPTGVKYPDIIPSFSFITPLNTFTTGIQAKRNRQARNVITKSDCSEITSEIDELIQHIADKEKTTCENISEAIKEKPKKEPTGFAEYMSNRNNDATKATDEATSSETDEAMDLE